MCRLHECWGDWKGQRRKGETKRWKEDTGPERGEDVRERKKEKERMSERVASCGSLYESTNLLLQYCNNGEHISPRIIIIAYQTYLGNAHFTVSISSPASYLETETFSMSF